MLTGAKLTGLLSSAFCPPLCVLCLVPSCCPLGRVLFLTFEAELCTHKSFIFLQEEVHDFVIRNIINLDKSFQKAPRRGACATFPVADKLRFTFQFISNINLLKTSFNSFLFKINSSINETLFNHSTIFLYCNCDFFGAVGSVCFLKCQSTVFFVGRSLVPKT